MGCLEVCKHDSGRGGRVMQQGTRLAPIMRGKELGRRKSVEPALGQACCSSCRLQNRHSVREGTANSERCALDSSSSARADLPSAPTRALDPEPEARAGGWSQRR